MARIKNGILGGFSGKLGPVVGYGVGKKSFIRTLPNVPKKFTAKELLNQKKFKLVSDYLNPFSPLLKVGFKNYFTETGGLRAAISYTYKNALLLQDDAWKIDPALIKISGGELPQAIAPTVALSMANTLTISWKNKGRSNLNDQLILLVYDTEKSYAMTMIYDGPLRHTGQVELKLPKRLQKRSLDIYIGFIAADRSIQSDSQYLGRHYTALV